MDRQTLNVVKHALVRGAGRLTWPWIAVAVLLAFAGGITLSVILPARHELAALHRHLADLQQQVHRNESEASASVRDSPLTQLGIFYGYFPPVNSLPDWLDKLLDAARDNQLQLKEGEYHIAQDKGGRLLRYQVTLPLTGSYLNIRRFLSAVLNDVPTASLDNVKFERQKIGDSAIEAKVELTLYFGQAS